MIREPERRVAMITICALLGIALYLVWQITAPFWSGIFLGIVLGISGYPIHAALERRWRKPALAALAATVAIIALVVGPVLSLAVTVAREAQGLYRTLALSSQSQGGWSVWFAALVERPLEWLARSTGMPVPSLQAALMFRLQEAADMALGRIGGLFGNVTSTLLEAIITFLTLYSFFRGAKHLRELAAYWVPLPSRRVEELLDVASEAIRANVYGTLVMAVVQGALVGIGFTIVGLPSPWLWGVVATICSLVPMLGTALVWAPGAAVLLISGSWIRAMILALWCLLVVVGVGDNFIRPLILRGRMPMNSLLIVLSILGGVEYFGLAGVIAGPVVFSITTALFKILREMLEEHVGAAQQPGAGPASG
jgi:predicted PurR-regulated permease PerM